MGNSIPNTTRGAPNPIHRRGDQACKWAYLSVSPGWSSRCNFIWGGEASSQYHGPHESWWALYVDTRSIASHDYKSKVGVAGEQFPMLSLRTRPFLLPLRSLPPFVLVLLLPPLPSVYATRLEALGARDGAPPLFFAWS